MFQWLTQPDPKELLKAVSDRIPRLLGDKLVSLVVFGKHASDEKHAGPVQVMCVVETVDVETLNELAEQLGSLSGKQLLAPMILTEAELHASTDVFPITFIDMKHHHRLLAGRDILSSLEIDHSHLRLRCEQELKNLQLRMQSAYLLHRSNAGRLSSVLVRNFASLLRALRSALLLSKSSATGADDEVLERASELMQLDAAILKRVAKLVAIAPSTSADVASSLFVELLLVVRQAADFVDRMPDDILVLDTAED